jgi:hypothetical protein
MQVTTSKTNSSTHHLIFTVITAERKSLQVVANVEFINNELESVSCAVEHLCERSKWEAYGAINNFIREEYAKQSK